MTMNGWGGYRSAVDRGIALFHALERGRRVLGEERD